MNVKRFLIILFCVIILIVSSIYAMDGELYFLAIALMNAACLFYICIFSDLNDNRDTEEDESYFDQIRYLAKLSEFEERKQTSHRTYHR